MDTHLHVQECALEKERKIEFAKFKIQRNLELRKKLLKARLETKEKKGT
jgi:hypothetical protein